MKPILQWVKLLVRAFLELGIVLALGYWGYQTGNGTALKVFLSIAAPLLGFGFWSLVDFRKADSLAEPLRLMQELLICGLAMLALYRAGGHTLGFTMGAISIVHYVLVYASGGTLLKH